MPLLSSYCSTISAARCRCRGVRGGGHVTASSRGTSRPANRYMAAQPFSTHSAAVPPPAAQSLRRDLTPFSPSRDGDDRTESVAIAVSVMQAASVWRMTCSIVKSITVNLVVCSYRFAGKETSLEVPAHATCISLFFEK